MKCLTLTVSALALLLAACAPADPAAEEAATAPDAAEAPADVQAESLPASLGNPAIEEITEDYEVRAVVDSRIVAFDDVLAQLLFNEARASLNALKEQAVADRESAEQTAAENGTESWFRQYSMDYRFEQTARAGDIISILQNVSTYTGGAHPNYALRGFVYQRGEPDQIAITGIVADPAGFGARLKHHLVEAKIQRGYAEAERASVAAEVDELTGDDATAGTRSGANFVLAPSTEDGKFGGIAVLFSPYDVGPYAEGAYVITVPAAELTGMLTDDWAGRFGGEPVLSPDAP